MVLARCYRRRVAYPLTTAQMVYIVNIGAIA